MDRSFLRRVVCLASITALSGCFRGSNPAQFYMLAAADTGKVAAAAVDDGPLIGLGPIRIPAYLDRDQIVTAVSDQEYKLADNHRWAERLDVTLARVSAENLSKFIPSERIVLHPWPREPKPDIQVSIDVQDLYVDAAGQARLDALWAVRSDKSPAVNREFSCRLPASTIDYARMVDAESQCLARLNRAIADTLRPLVAGFGS